MMLLLCKVHNKASPSTHLFPFAYCIGITRKVGIPMSSYLNQNKMTLTERLSLHSGFSVALQAKGFSSEPGLLQKVGRQFIKVNNQYFLPYSLEQISLLGFEPKVSGELVHIRSISKGNFSARLIRTGADFVEVIMNNVNADWLLIPLNNIISVERR
jgi:hypothetical protein